MVQQRSSSSSKQHGVQAAAGGDALCLVGQNGPHAACDALPASSDPAPCEEQQQKQHLQLAAEFDRGGAVVSRVGGLGPHYWQWLRQPDSGHPRFFTSPFLEGCSKTPWWVVPLLWLPAFTACFAHASQQLGVPSAALVAWLFIGIVCWQLLEYTIHRFVFHARFSSYWGITFHFLFHGCHHKYPMDSLRLVFPPVPASLVMATVWVVLHALLPRHHALPLFAGMGYGYVAYDCLHYALHHCGPAGLPWGPLQDLRQRHMHHHYKNSCRGFGISSVLFDVVFRTSM